MLNYRSKNYLLFLLLVLFSSQIFAQKSGRKVLTENKSSESMKAGAFIDVNVATYTPSNYTIEQLIKNVLISGGSSCAPPNVSNVTVSPNQLHTDTERAWGYFHKGTTNFPFNDGVVLVTGKARRAGNVLEGNLGDTVPGSTGSDPDLVTAINPSAGLNDAVFIEFDFVPNNSQINFNYIFASEEYTSTFPCGVFSDGFALLLKPNTPGSTYTNMAILPGGNGPVSVTNIVPGGVGFACGPINAAYFGGLNTTNIETNFNGRTIPLTATATVTPGQSYHFKMVLADASDSGYDSAVFIQGGSFDLGMTIVDPNGNPIPESINVCDNTPTVLKAQITVLPGTTYQWFKDGVPIPGATSMTYTATTPGVYKVQVTVPGASCPVEAQVTIIGGTSPVIQNATLKLCATPSNSTFNLDSAKPSISTTAGAVFKFYLQQADAVAGNANNITATTAFNGTDGQILYVNVSNGAFCSRVAMLTLRKEETPVATVTAPRIKICNGESVVLTAAGGVTYQWGDNSASGAVRTVSPSVTTTYSVYAIGAQGCKSLQPASITIEVVPAITSTLTGGWICNGDNITLDAGAGPNYTYQWSNGATTQTITVGAGGIYGVTISNGVCTKLFTTEVKIAVPPTITNINYANDNITISVSNPSNGALEYSLDNGLTWQNSNIFTNVPKNKLVFIQVRVKTTSCVGYLEYYTFNMQNVITPNGDNVNDIIDFRGVAGNKNFTAQVSDRYGRVVYRYEKVRPYWDGFFQGKKLSTSSYWYQITFEDPASKQTTVKTGWILLKNIE
ncbi:choice-of-anchor L domain-containing protein [Chryseobacterium sp. Leaf394]|uniref:choice-of-anchor L domain-containing protein n=1 Tax=Chryseobacterium sp. Leaf394 TaxID=1736361 RepID=UPI0006FA5416|nr:choice-of-anchor L domain-containing protein [Chryseobacterium sp. Leaf394]KQS91561.1 gliding motility protein [Chryseobacterium sp. Leaf394]